MPELQEALDEFRAVVLYYRTLHNSTALSLGTKTIIAVPIAEEAEAQRERCATRQGHDPLSVSYMDSVVLLDKLNDIYLAK